LFLSLTLDGRKWLASIPSHFTSSTYWVGDWLSIKIGLDVMVSAENPFPVHVLSQKKAMTIHIQPQLLAGLQLHLETWSRWLCAEVKSLSAYFFMQELLNTCPLFISWYLSDKAINYIGKQLKHILLRWNIVQQFEVVPYVMQSEHSGLLKQFWNRNVL
jgi:hypothetical protein